MRPSSGLRMIFFAICFYLFLSWLNPDLFLRSDGPSDCPPSFSASATRSLSGERRLIVEVSHGLGNRLRAYASAAALAARTGRALELVWARDVHLKASFSELFEGASDVLLHTESFLNCATASPHFEVYDYMKNPVDWKKRKAVNHRTKKHIYVRTAYELKGRQKVRDEEIAAALQKIRPSNDVRTLMYEIEEQFKEECNVELSECVGVHIRMQNNLAKDIPGIFSLPKTDPRHAGKRMQAVAKSRLKCHHSHFSRVIKSRQRDKMDKPGQVYFVVADCQEARDALRENFGKYVFSPRLRQHRACEGENSRSSDCVRLALAELLLLVRMNTLIYSDESSFSEIILKFGLFGRQPSSGCSA